MGNCRSTASQPLVSVVIPVFNGERYLGECIESVLAQTYGNWDLTIIDNCSTDKTLAIAQVYAAADTRIRIHSNERFLRVIENHNVALRHIAPGSKYCKPLAADDMLLPECLERMVCVAEQNPSVVIVGAYGLYSRPDMGVYCKGVPYGCTVLVGRELCRRYLLADGGPSVWGAPTFTLLRSDVVRSRTAFYNESNLHADSECCLDLLENHDFGFVHQILTFMRVEEGSLTSFSIRFNTYLAHRLEMLAKYGPRYLTEEELVEQIRRQLREYYRYLGWQVFKGRPREFWEYHSSKLAAAGHSLNAFRLGASAMSYLAYFALSPARILSAALRHARRLV